MLITPPPFYWKQVGVTVTGPPLATAQSSSSVNRNITIPSGVIAGDLLLAILTTSNGSAVTLSPPTGWSNVTGAASSNANTNQGAFYKISDGTEGGTTVTSTDSSLVTNSVAVCYRITGHDPATPPEAANANNASSATPDPPNLTPSWGSAANLWIAAFGRRSAACTMDAYASGYTIGQVGGDASNCKTFAATKVATASSENPGTFTLSNAAQWNALTIAVRPA